MFQLVLLALEKRRRVVVEGDRLDLVALGDLVDHILALGDFAEDRVLAVEVRCRAVSDEELAAVGVGA